MPEEQTSQAVVRWQFTIALAALGSLLMGGYFATIDMRLPEQTLRLIAQNSVLLGISPYVVLALLPLFRLKRTAATLAILTGLAAWGLVIYFVFFSSPATRPAEIGAVAYRFGGLLALPALAALICHLSLLAAGIQTFRDAGPRLALVCAYIGGVVLCLSSAGMANNLYRFWKSPEYGQMRAQRKSMRSYTELQQLKSCLGDYGAKHGGEYPQSLLDLGPAGMKCASRAVAENHIEGYNLRYIPRRENGRIRGYEFEVIPTNNNLQAGHSIQTESGATFASRAADGTLKDPISSPDMGIQVLDKCLEQYRLKSLHHGYPAALAALRRPELCDTTNGAFGEAFREVMAGNYMGYKFSYTPAPANDSGMIDSFRLDVRPLQYGALTRSYMCDPHGELRVTDDDRPAQASDRNIEHDEELDEDNPNACVGQRQDKTTIIDKQSITWP